MWHFGENYFLMLLIYALPDGKTYKIKKCYLHENLGLNICEILRMPLCVHM